MTEAGRVLATWAPPQISAALTNLRLSNPSNLCYLHSIIHLLLHVVLPLAPSDLRPTGMLLTALKAMEKHQNKPVRILDMVPWRIVLRDWQHIHTQQDCTEVFKYLLDRCRFPALSCTWEARVLNETLNGQQTSMQDRGAVISLVIPSDAETETVQDCIDMWHQQPYVHAMTTRPPLLALVLARSSDPDRGKNCQRIACRPQATISVPVFSQSIATSWHRYTLVGGIKHIGRRPQSGHYRAFAVHCSSSQINAAHESSPAPPRASVCELWQFDDGVKAVRCNQEDISDIECNCYMLCYQAE